MRISDWSSDVCSSDLLEAAGLENETRNAAIFEKLGRTPGLPDIAERVPSARRPALAALMEKNSFTNGTLTPYESWAAALLLSRSEEHTSELQSLMRISYAVFCLKTNQQTIHLSTI